MTVEEIREIRIAEAERTKNMSHQEIMKDSKARAQVMLDKLEAMKNSRTTKQN